MERESHTLSPAISWGMSITRRAPPFDQSTGVSRHATELMRSYPGGGSLTLCLGKQLLKSTLTIHRRVILAIDVAALDDVDTLTFTHCTYL